MTRAEEILAEARARIERGKKESEQRIARMNKEWEAEQKAFQEKFQKRMDAQNNDLVCRIFGVTPEWARAHGVQM